jgi:diadenosine tetraphosphate (Ap4A) HIT family hydrolase
MEKHWFRRSVRPEDGEGKMLCSLVYSRILYATFNDTTRTVYIECLNNKAKHKISHLHSHLISGNQNEKNEMSETCSTNGGDERSIRGFGAES